ncbi:MAG: type I-MYXAN CRISPR-associated protein Cas6/Cmx6 [Proteobacteria bacterium]|jgi:CRISPR-associated protein Cas6|nr:type I-MYXAN CRISPR-associated protein Cas6/Cmx6 [Pseudomonadota bacterium]
MSSAYWTESELEKAKPIKPVVVDIVFKIRGQQIAADHAYALSKALTTELPWLGTEREVSIHLIHGAQSANGWCKPDDSGIIELSGRTRLIIRVPHSRLEDAKALIGASLNLDEHKIEILDAKPRPLSTNSTIFSHHVRSLDDTNSEPAFLGSVARWLEGLAITPKKMLCGGMRHLKINESVISTRSLLIAELNPNESITVQTHGLGPDRLFGCGVFVPSKSISAVHQPESDH